MYIHLWMRIWGSILRSLRHYDNYLTPLPIGYYIFQSLLSVHVCQVPEASPENSHAAPAGVFTVADLSQTNYPIVCTVLSQWFHKNVSCAKVSLLGEKDNHLKYLGKNQTFCNLSNYWNHTYFKKTNNIEWLSVSKTERVSLPLYVYLASVLRKTKLSLQSITLSHVDCIHNIFTNKRQGTGHFTVTTFHMVFTVYFYSL